MSNNSNNSKYITIFCSIIFLALSLVVYNKKNNVFNNAINSTKINITTSFYPLEFLVKEIGQDFMNVNNITPAGTEPHEYEPTAQQIVDISKSDWLITNGAGLESWTSKMEQNKTLPKNVLELTKYFELSSIDEDGKTIKDPHIWLSPKIYISMATKVGLTIQQNETIDKQATMQKNLQSLTSKLESLDAKYRSKLNNTNCRTNKFVTNHNAFNYLAKEYNLEAISINGLSPESEPTTKELADLSEIIRTNNLKYIFTETTATPKLADTLAKEVGIQTLELNTLEGLRDEEIKSGKNYINIMEQNLQNLALALDCK